MSTELTFLFILVCILMYSAGSFHSFTCFNYSSHRFGLMFFLFSCNEPPSCLSLNSSLTILRASFLSCYLYTHSLYSSSLGSNVSCYCSLIHGSSLRLLSPTYFNPSSSPKFPDVTPLLSLIFNYLPLI